MDGSVSADNLFNSSGDSGFTIAAKNSAHFTVTSLTPGVTLTLDSGCNISNGLGCDVPGARLPSLTVGVCSELDWPGWRFWRDAG